MNQPCPFCGDEHLAIFQIARRVQSSGVTVGVAGSGAFVECGTCGGRSPEAKTAELAWDAWNRRACPAVERLRAELAAAVAAHEESDAAFHEASDEVERLENLLADITAERDRLLTALAAVVEVSDSESATMDTHFEVLEMARSVLADTARAANLRLTGVVPVLHVRDGGACTCGCPADDGLLAERDRLRAVAGGHAGKHGAARLLLDPGQR